MAKAGEGQWPRVPHANPVRPGLHCPSRMWPAICRASHGDDNRDGDELRGRQTWQAWRRVVHGSITPHYRRGTLGPGVRGHPWGQDPARPAQSPRSPPLPILLYTPSEPPSPFPPHRTRVNALKAHLTGGDRDRCGLGGGGEPRAVTRPLQQFRAPFILKTLEMTDPRGNPGRAVFTEKTGHPTPVGSFARSLQPTRQPEPEPRAWPPRHLQTDVRGPEHRPRGPPSFPPRGLRCPPLQALLSAPSVNAPGSSRPPGRNARSPQLTTPCSAMATRGREGQPASVD